MAKKGDYSLPAGVLGRIVIPYRGRTVNADLVANRTWVTGDPTLSKSLDAHFPATADNRSPAAGRPGAVQLAAAASVYGVEVEWPPEPDYPAGICH